MLTDFLSALIIKSLLFPFRFLSHRALHHIGKILGTGLYFCMSSYRKRALSNLSLAKDLDLSSDEIKQIAKESFQNLAITCLEYPKLQYSKKLDDVIFCKNKEKAQELVDSGKGVIFFCGHQANWEVLFLEGSKRMPGIAIGRPIKNHFLYDWVLKIRERFGGKIVPPHKALKEGLRALKSGSFVGIVGDQGMPGSNYSSLFLGAKAWTSSAPALLAYKTMSPIIVATTERKEGKYIISYSEPIWPNHENSLDEEVVNLMDKTLEIFAESIKKNPGQWLWQHNRWKQETAELVYYRFRYESLLILLPENLSEVEKIAQDLKTFRLIYPHAFITIAMHESYKELDLIPLSKKLIYKDHEELFLDSYLYKLVFNFTSDNSLRKHFMKKSAFKVLSLEDLKELSQIQRKNKESPSFSEILEKALCRKSVLRSDDATL